MLELTQAEFVTRATAGDEVWIVRVFKRCLAPGLHGWTADSHPFASESEARQFAASASGARILKVTVRPYVWARLARMVG